MAVDLPDPDLSKTAGRLIDRLLTGFDTRHHSLANRALQFVAVPIMMWSGLAMLMALPEPSLLAAIPGIDWAVVAALLVSAAYGALSLRLGAAMAIACLVLMVIAAFYSGNETLPLWQPAIVFFGIGALLWLVGRRLEGRPRLISEMIADLSVGPAWILSRLLTALRIGY